MTPTRLRAAAAIAALGLAGCGRVFGARATLGPGAIIRGRGLYNEVITATNNEQTLAQIVRARYGEPAGLLAVASVTANLRAAETTNAQFGIGPSSNYSGNIVPLSVGVAFEDNPTIAYTPVQGERYAKSILSPLGLDVLVLLLGMERAPDQLVSILIKQVNGLHNPMYRPPEARAAFQDSIALLTRLEQAGHATWTSTSAKETSFALELHDYAPDDRETVHDLLARWGLPPSLARGDRDVVLPVKLAVGNPTKPGLNVQTRSVFDLIALAAGAVQVPPEHAALGLPDPGLDALSGLGGLLTIRSSPSYPRDDVLVAVRHRGYWFYIPAADGPSKLAFRMLQTIIGMRLTEAAPAATPALTIPVAR